MEPDAMKTTGWIDGRAKPLMERTGVYQRKFGGVIRWSRWNGECWKANCFSKEEAAKATQNSLYQNLPWRGLAKPPMHNGDISQ
jgi:hypothetical protein